MCMNSTAAARGMWRVPLYAQHSALSFYVNDSNVRSGGFANGPFESNGQGRFYGARLTHKLKAAPEGGADGSYGFWMFLPLYGKGLAHDSVVQTCSTYLPTGPRWNIT